MTNTKVFLTPSIEQIKHSIKGIDDSYNNCWDIYAELIQNSVDAIRQCNTPEGKIKICVDCPSKSITIEDNGIGINPEELPSLLKPFSTNKAKCDVSIGEKGVGLKFVIFSSNSFKIVSGNNLGTSKAEIMNAYHWKNSIDETELSFNHEIEADKMQGTIVCVKEVDQDTIFNLKYEQFVFLLRTRTALGSTKNIWGEDKKILIQIEYTDINSKSTDSLIPFSYWLPIEGLGNNSKIDLKDFQSWLSSGDRTDQEKRLKLKDKIIYSKGNYVHKNNRNLNFFACFVPKRNVWDQLSVRFKLSSEENIDDEEWIAKYYYAKLNDGIYTSVKGMPTGISIDHPTTGYSGYWSNFFILFEDPFLKFDIGRKSIHGSQANVHRKYAKEIFNEYLKYVTKYVSGDPQLEPTEWNKDEIFSEINSLIDLNIDSIHFKKAPSDQEATVAAIFFECIGSGLVQNISPLICGYRNKYDLYALWDRKKIIIEFKSRLSKLIKDFTDAKKMFDEINCIVCWEITDEDVQKMSDKGVTVEKICTSSLSTDPRQIPHSTHIMSLSGFTNPIYIIDLKYFLNIVKVENK